MDRLKHMKETLMCCVEGQMSHLDTVDTKELGEAIDMLKDLEEAIYYATITKAMKEQDEDGQEEKKFKKYMEHYEGGREHAKEDYFPSAAYYGGDGRNGSSPGRTRNGNDDYGSSTSTTRPSEPMNGRETTTSTPRENEMEGRSGRSRRQYMDAKYQHKDSATQMRELEKYMSELSSDIMDMLEDASAEERQYLAKKMTTLATKLEAVH